MQIDRNMELGERDMIRYEKRKDGWAVILEDISEIKELMEFEDYLTERFTDKVISDSVAKKMSHE